MNPFFVLVIGLQDAQYRTEGRSVEKCILNEILCAVWRCFTKIHYLRPMDRMPNIKCLLVRQYSKLSRMVRNTL